MSSTGLSTLLAELKRRRVFRVAVVYDGVTDGLAFRAGGLPGWLTWGTRGLAVLFIVCQIALKNIEKKQKKAAKQAGR